MAKSRTPAQTKEAKAEAKIARKAASTPTPLHSSLAP